MNVANPERIVADHNISRAATTGTLDVDYLATLSGDAVPVLFDRLEELDGVLTDVDDSRGETATSAQERLRQRLCDAGDGLGQNSGLSFNSARHEALKRCDVVC